jgi:beta-galactosidase beta subunit
VRTGHYKYRTQKKKGHFQEYHRRCHLILLQGHEEGCEPLLKTQNAKAKTFEHETELFKDSKHKAAIELAAKLLAFFSTVTSIV